MVAGAALSLAVMIYLKGQGYGLVSDTPPATEGRVDGIARGLDEAREDIASLRQQSERQETRLDALAQIIVEQDIGRPKPPPTGIVEAE